MHADLRDCVKCGMPRFDRDVLEGPWCRRCQKEQQEEYKPIRVEWIRKNAETLLTQMGVPPTYRSRTLRNFEVNTEERRRVLRTTEEWLGSPTPGLFLCGPCGTGKTHLAVGALLEMYAVRNFIGKFVSTQELLLECRDSFRRDSDGLADILDRYSRADLLVLDDLGAENSTEFARETLGLLIDRSYKSEQTLIVTSNLDLEGLAHKLDARIADRLIELCEAVKLSGVSYRQRLAAQRIASRNRQVSEVVQ